MLWTVSAGPRKCVLDGVTLVPPEEYDGLMCAAAAMRSIAVSKVKQSKVYG